MSEFFVTLANDNLIVYFLLAATIVLAVIIVIMIRIIIMKTKAYKQTEPEIETEIEDDKSDNDEKDNNINNMFVDNRSISITINNFDKNLKEEDISNGFTSQDFDEDYEEEAEEVSISEELPKRLRGRIFSFCRKSFTARLIQSKPQSQEFYSELKNYILSFKHLKSRVSWNFDSFNCGRKKMIKFNIKGKTLVMYIALIPKKFEDTKYHFKNVKDIKKYKKVPMMVYIRSHRATKYAKELINILMSKNDILQKEIPQTDYRMAYESKEELIKKGLIKPPYKSKTENNNKEKLKKEA